MRKMPVVSSIHFHFTHSCEANKRQNSKPFFACGRSRTSNHSHRKKFKKISLRVYLLQLKIGVLWVFENSNILSSKSNTVTKSEISPEPKLGSLQNLKLNLIR